MGGNLKPAPLPLTGDLVAKLAGDRPALGKGIVHLPIIRQARDDRQGQTCDCLGCKPAAAEPDDIDVFGGGIEF